ncbi:DUF1534 domain-containing protein [Pseudomonas savastanoi pv. phaseolicola]|uniref:DUF1534 domain-containing protein n=1 Tax=Pseudomonas amygdali pv. lachrymans str. M301315 TaxID=629260 RepID=A0AAD0LY78_PSEAV|nr:DUF1534 domain-containing protein [Pseudomonas amygdali pv. lachrymans str. M301315]MBN3469251.1 DUF1534 domain-containing protein [Pseudomonas savastanoi pv. phaseolicola]PWC99682.1 hypothetical protein CX658_25865 [Pseudomonas amygdali pv. lachrymans]PYD23328.1 DUF1534 domain-containing protein [Pseudomonas savastanoi pv. glycinea]QDW00038.1 DUF1534 domain-containing protein [Pseudomonas sp. KBS0707]QED83924.1 DUF1534 domain-containing protein [Pseudomonas amygdali pv. tabaci str. ATCC 11
MSGGGRRAGVEYRANAPRWHASRDAPRHRSAQQHPLKVGRRGFRNAFPR